MSRRKHNPHVRPMGAGSLKWTPEEIRYLDHMAGQALPIAIDLADEAYRNDGAAVLRGVAAKTAADLSYKIALECLYRRSEIIAHPEKFKPKETREGSNPDNAAIGVSTFDDAATIVDQKSGRGYAEVEYRGRRFALYFGGSYTGIPAPVVDAAREHFRRFRG